MLASFLADTQFFVHNKSSSTSQLIKGKSSDLKNLLRYLSGMVVSLFQGCIGGCGA